MNKRRISLFTRISVAVFLLTSLMLPLARSDRAVADFLDAYVCTPFRRAMASLGDLTRISVFEILVLLIPIAAIVLIILSISIFSRGYGRCRFVLNVLSIALLLYSGNTLALGISYNTTPIDARMALSPAEVNATTLRDALEELCLEINTINDKIDYCDGQSHSGYDLWELSEKICESYSDFSDDYSYPVSFVSHVKGVDALHFMSYLGLTGIYTYYTGESNVNTDYPDYTVAFTSAHELAHQRGILRENETNFMAYLVCSRSDDLYLRYSAALNMLGYVGNALYRTDRNAYYEVLSTLDARALDDMRAASRVSAEYADTFIADISDFVNDLFLKSNGTDGIVTYGRVVTLYMSYRASAR